MPTAPSPAIYAFTRQGAALARRLGLLTKGHVHLHTRCARPGESSFESIHELMAATFSSHPAHIFVGAAGIAVRAIAPHLKSKTDDPCVLVVDQDGAFCVSLVGGHLGGGNALARDIADITGGQAVITTGTDRQAVPSIDLLAQETGLVIGNPEAIKHVSGFLLDGGQAALYDPDNRLNLSTQPENAHFFQPADKKEAAEAACAVWVDYRVQPAAPCHLRLHPPVLSVGVGCRKDVPAKEILDHLSTVFASNELYTESIAGLASINAKSDEPGLLEAAGQLGVPITFYSPEELEHVAVPTPSSRVKHHVGVESVCEAAAMTLARTNRLIVSKSKSERVTLAVAL